MGWRKGLPAASGALFTAGLAVELSHLSWLERTLAAGLSLFIAGSLVGGVWLALLVIHHNDQESKAS